MQLKDTEWLKHDDEVAEWDAFVERHPFGWLSQLSCWRDILERSFRHIRGRFLVLRDGSGEITAGVPVYSVESRFLKNRLVSVPFATLCDPLISTKEEMSRLLPCLQDACRETGNATLELRTLHSDLSPGFPDLGSFRFYKHHYLVLDRSPDELFKRFQRSTIRKVISRAIRNGISIEEGSTAADLATFYEFLVCSRRDLGLPLIPFRFFQSMWDVLKPRGQLLLLLARCEGQIIGAILSLRHREIFSAEFIGDNPEFRWLGVNRLLYWESIKSACADGYKVFSFGRTSPGNTGLMDYKGRWGTTVGDLPVFVYPRKTFKGGEKKKASFSYAVARTLLRKTPYPLYRLFGELCYRHMG